MIFHVIALTQPERESNMRSFMAVRAADEPWKAVMTERRC
jgi:hypothetical protein